VRCGPSHASQQSFLPPASVVDGGSLLAGSGVAGLARRRPSRLVPSASMPLPIRDVGVRSRGMPSRMVYVHSGQGCYPSERANEGESKATASRGKQVLRR